MKLSLVNLCSSIIASLSGRTIFITIDKEDILKKQLKENLLKLNAMTSGADSTSQIQYILNANNEMTVYDDVDLLQSSVQQSIAMERDVSNGAGDSRNVNHPPKVEQWINVTAADGTTAAANDTTAAVGCETELVQVAQPDTDHGDLFYDTI